MTRRAKDKAASGRTRRRRPRSVRKDAYGLAAIEVAELDSVRDELQRLAAAAGPPRWNANPDDVRRSVAKLVLTLVEFIRHLLERQAIRRMDAGTLTGEQIEAVGLALMRLEDTVRELGAQFDLAPEDLNLDLGPIGRLT